MSNAKTHILVVEDSAQDQELIQHEISKRTDCEASFVFTGLEAIECLKDTRKRFHLVLLDLNLQMMQQDGRWVLDQMRKLEIRTPVAILSGVYGGEAMEAMKSKPIITCIEKPLTQEKIEELMNLLWV